jgi:N-acetylglucosamine kinase-like BadF-type ATPase
LQLNKLLSSILKTCQILAQEKSIWCISAAGASDIKACERLKTQILKFVPFGSEICIIPDSVGNHFAAFAGKDGVLSIAGTGSIQFARFAEKETTAGGWGFLLDETPSAAFFGRQALLNVLEFIEGDLSKASFAEIFKKLHFKPNREKILNSLYQATNFQTYLGKYAQVTTMAYDNKIEHTQNFVKGSFKTLANQIMTLIKRTKPPNKSIRICSCGGLAENWPSFHSLFSTSLQSLNVSFDLIKPAFPQSLGPLIYLAQTNEFARKIFANISEKENNNEY